MHESESVGSHLLRKPIDLVLLCKFNFFRINNFYYNKRDSVYCFYILFVV